MKSISSLIAKSCCLAFISIIVFSNNAASAFLQGLSFESGYMKHRLQQEYLNTNLGGLVWMWLFDCPLGSYICESYNIRDWNLTWTYSQQGIEFCSQDIKKSDFKVYNANCDLWTFPRFDDTGVQCRSDSVGLILRGGFVRKTYYGNCALYSVCPERYESCGLPPPPDYLGYGDGIGESSYAFRLSCQGEIRGGVLKIRTYPAFIASETTQPLGQEFLINGASPVGIYPSGTGYNSTENVYEWRGELYWEIPVNGRCGETVTITPSLTKGYGYAVIYSILAEFCEDKDGDGYTTCDNDCNDNDNTVYPGATETCDGKDNDCNGKVDDLPQPLVIQPLKQNDSIWGANIYDNTSKNISKKGCALTSAVMALRHYGITTGADGREVSPDNLNEWLNGNKGYSESGDIVWPAIEKYSGDKIVIDKIDGRNDEMLNDDFNNGRPVILDVSSSTRQHFVVATGSMCVANGATWTINDPGYDITTLQGYGNTYHGLRRIRLK
jgi:hypothetical protein